MNAMGKNLPNAQTCGLATKACPPNVKQLDYPPTKKSKMTHAAPGTHIAVNLAAAPGPSRPEQVAGAAPDPRPAGRTVYIPIARRTVLAMLTECANAGRVPSAQEILTWMDGEIQDIDGNYLDSHSELQAFGIEDAFDIMEMEVCFLATIGNLGRGGATRLRQYTRDNILMPLGLWATKVKSISSVCSSMEMGRIVQWQRGVEGGYDEDAESAGNIRVKVEEEDMVEVSSTDSSGIEEIESWGEVNVGQWEKEI